MLNSRSNKPLLTLALVSLSVFGSQSQAATVPSDYVACNNGGEHAFGLTNATGCAGFGSGNINGGNNDDFLGSAAGADFSLILKEGSHWTGGNVEGNSIFNFSIDASLWQRYDTLAIGTKVGENLETSWAAWTIQQGATQFKLFVSPKQGGGLSHFNVYGTVATAPAPVPLPGAVWLFVSGVAGFAGMRFKQKSKA